MQCSRVEEVESQIDDRTINSPCSSIRQLVIQNPFIIYILLIIIISISFRGPFLRRGMTLAIFHSDETVRELNEVKDAEITGAAISRP